jgi:hypothetical protein
MSTSKALQLATVLLFGNCPAVPRDREADALQDLAVKLMEADRTEQARGLLSDALPRHLAIEDHRAASKDAALLSRVHQKANQFRDALRLADVARAEAVLSGSDETMANALTALGDTLERVGDHPLALEVYTEAERYVPESNKKTRAWLAIHSSLALRDLGRRRDARKKLEEGRDFAREAGEHRMVVGSCTNLASIALIEGRLEDAERDLRDAHAAQRRRDPRRVSPGAMLNQAVLERLRGDLSAATAALDCIQPPFSEDTRWTIAYERGMIAEARGALQLAEFQLAEAVSIIEKLRSNLAPEDAKAPFLEERWAPYESLFALRLRRGDAQAAFDTLTKAQGRMFLDALAVSLAETSSTPASRVDGAIGRFARLEQAMPVLADSGIGPTRTSEKTLADVRGKHILAYFQAGRRLHLLTVVDGEPRATSVAVDLERLDRLIDDFRSRPEDPRAAEDLGRALLPPESLPPPPERLHIVPVGQLLRVSFAALRVSGARLLDRYEVVYAPSVTGLAEMATARDAAKGSGLVVADTRRDLAHATRESRVVVEQTGAKMRVGLSATTTALRSAAELPLLHVISHSGIGVRGGYLVLADGQVTAADILEWRVRPRLVVLPTCASALTVRGEMWDSLAAAFLAAGSRHVVATVASVEDRVAADFTRHFYSENGLRDPVGGVTRSLRKMAKHYPVADWSAFVVAGL